MASHTLDEINAKVIQLCTIHGYNNKDVLNNCFKIIHKYLAFDNSSLDILFYCLEDGINNDSWLLTWKKVNEEIDKLSGKYYFEQEKAKKESVKILLDYEPLNLGERILNAEELTYLKIKLGLIDSFGVFHTSERLNVDRNKWPDHRKIANYLRLKNKIVQYYIRVGCICGQNDGILCAESMSYGDKESLKNFLLNEKMAIALYNAVMSKKDARFSTFEEKLAFYGTEFGYYSTKFDLASQIYDTELFNNNIKVLSYTLGNKFDKKFFIDILKG